MNETRTETPHRVRNQSEYHDGLVERRSFRSLSMDQAALDAWRAPERGGKPGRLKESAA